MATELENAEAIDFVESAKAMSKEELIFEVQERHKLIFCGQPSVVDKKLYFSCQARLFNEFGLGKDYSTHPLNPFRIGATVTPTVENGVIVNKRSNAGNTISLEPMFCVKDVIDGSIVKTGTEAECYIYWARANKVIGFAQFKMEKVEGEYTTKGSTLKLPEPKKNYSKRISIPVVVKKDEFQGLLDEYFQKEKDNKVIKETQAKE